MESNKILLIIAFLVVILIHLFIDKVKQPRRTYFKLIISLSLFIAYYFYGGESSIAGNILFAFLLAFNIITAIMEYIIWNKKSTIKQNNVFK